MAGIGFELRKYLRSGTYLGTIKTYGYASIIGSGPWLLSILGVMLVGLLSVNLHMDANNIVSYLVSVTWLMATSLIATGLFLLAFIRFTADLLYEKKNDILLANVGGILLCCTLLSGFSSTLVMWFFFPNQSLLYRLLMVVNFVTLCNLWFSVVFSSAMKQYKVIFSGFLLGYTTVVVSSLALQSKGLEGLLTSLFIGHAALFFFMLSLIHPQYPSNSLIRFDFFRRDNIYIRLVFIGLFYNVGVWVDKLLFWMSPLTGSQVIGPLRTSLIYDLPIFLAHLTIIPGMAVFLIRVETDFYEAYSNYFQAIREGETLQNIEALSKEIFNSVVGSFVQIVKVQGITMIGVCLLAPSIIDWLGISQRYLNLLYIGTVGVAFQLILLAILNFLFYLNRLTEALYLTLLLMVSNVGLTWITLQLSPHFYGLGFLGSMFITSLAGLFTIFRTLRKLEYYTFLQQT